MKREKEIKGWKSRLKIQKLISTEYPAADRQGASRLQLGRFQV